jgi:formimidoylglutamate deiminase
MKALEKQNLRLNSDFCVDSSGNISSFPPGIASLPGKMILPGFVNTHSHAMQRALRGRVEKNDTSKGKSDFWSWRETMYSDVLRFDLDAIEVIASWCYLEMIKAGFVAVGEFHYLHHNTDGKPYSDPAAVSKRLAKAADRVGIRLVLLQTGYMRNGFNQPALPEQRRFIFNDADAFLSFGEHIREEIKGPLVSHGLAIHSVRACPRDFIAKIATQAHAQNLPLHVHACEQTQEIQGCLDEHGIKPIPLLEQCGALSSRTTLVHATHIDAHDISLMAHSDTMVSLCPSTEKNLGDGLCPIVDLHNAGIKLTLGSDQHARIDVADELRALEENERLRLQRRHVLTKPGTRLANALIPVATQNGWQSLFGTREKADYIGIKTPIEAELFGPDDALDAWLIAGNSSDVSDVFVAGKHVVKDGVHAQEKNIYDALKSSVRGLKS